MIFNKSDILCFRVLISIMNGISSSWLVMSTLYVLGCHTEGRVRRSAKESFSKHHVITPLVFNSKGQHIQTTLSEKNHENDISIIFSYDNTEIILDLHLNKQLLPGSFVEKIHTTQGPIINAHPANTTGHLHCYYHGHVRNDSQSAAAVSTCHGVSGTIFLHNDTLYIHPRSSVIDGQHYVFHASNELSSNLFCGVDAHYNKLQEHPTFHNRLKREVRWPAKWSATTKIVELYVVNDYQLYETYQRDVKKVVRRTKEIINAASALYKSLDIHIALVTVEVWTERDLISVSEDAEATMTNFLEYRTRHINPHHKNDNAQLLTDHQFRDGVIGKAPINTMCTFQYSGGVNMDHHALVGPVATTVAHEMGHNFGLAHDGAECSCPQSRCIMNRNSGGNQPKHWSSCSKKQFEDVFYVGMDYCLHDLPGELYQGPVCGNGFMEAGEQCDCGTPDSCTSKCCDAATCKLFSNATCATGACCDLDTCKLKARSTPCRESADTCDLGEYCHGDSEFCPSDAHRSDGTECEVDGKESYCYQGRCRNHESQCQLLWGSTGHKSHDICYHNYNRHGRANGHCGFFWTNKTFVACTPENTMCGMLHCRHENEKLMFWQETLAYTMPEAYIDDSRGVRQQCSGAILDAGLNYKDPGMVPDGSKCGDGFYCVDTKCRPIPNADICPDCNGEGVCNNLGQCHCHVGYAPPRCDRPGDGGSKHSGPINIHKSRMGLFVGLVFLFVVAIPIVAALIYILYRQRNELKKLWVAHTRKDKYRTIIQAKPSNAQPNTATQPSNATPKSPQQPVSVAKRPIATSAGPGPPPKKPPPPKTRPLPGTGNASVTRAHTQIYKGPRPPAVTNTVKRASSFSSKDIGEFKLESTTNTQLEKMAELPVSYRSPALDAARSNRPLSYPSSSHEEEMEQQHGGGNNGAVVSYATTARSTSHQRAQPTRPAPTHPTHQPTHQSIQPTRQAPTQPTRSAPRLPPVTSHVTSPMTSHPPWSTALRPTVGVGAHGSSANHTNTVPHPGKSSHKPDRPPLPDANKLPHRTEQKPVLPPPVPSNSYMPSSVSPPGGGGEIHQPGYYENVPNSQDQYNHGQSYPNHYETTDSSNTMPIYANEVAEDAHDTVSRMRNRFEGLDIAEKRPVPRPRSGLSEERKDFKPPLPAPLIKDNKAAHGRPYKPPVTAKPNLAGRKSNDSVC